MGSGTVSNTSCNRNCTDRIGAFHRAHPKPDFHGLISNIKSQNHRVSWVGKDHQNPTPGATQDSPKDYTISLRACSSAQPPLDEESFPNTQPNSPDTMSGHPLRSYHWSPQRRLVSWPWLPSEGRCRLWWGLPLVSCTLSMTSDLSHSMYGFPFWPFTIFSASFGHSLIAL